MAETAIFAIFVVAYIYYIGKSISGPQPRQVLELPIFNTVCLLSSSFTIWLAERGLKKSAMGAFSVWWALTVVLGAIFLGGTGAGMEEVDLSRWADHQHQSLRHHVLLAGRLACEPRDHRADHAFDRVDFCPHRKVEEASTRKQLEVLSLYWHFVDAVWVVVFTVVYIIGR